MQQMKGGMHLLDLLLIYKADQQGNELVYDGRNGGQLIVKHIVKRFYNNIMLRLYETVYHLPPHQLL